MKIKLVPNAKVSVGAIAEGTDVKSALISLLPYTLGMIWYNLELKNISDHFQMSFETSNVHVV